MEYPPLKLSVTEDGLTAETGLTIHLFWVELAYNSSYISSIAKIITVVLLVNEILNMTPRVVKAGVNYWHWVSTKVLIQLIVFIASIFITISLPLFIGESFPASLELIFLANVQSGFGWCSFPWAFNRYSLVVGYFTETVKHSERWLTLPMFRSPYLVRKFRLRDLSSWRTWPPLLSKQMSLKTMAKRAHRLVTTAFASVHS